MSERHLRPSQYVTTYGSGALLLLSGSRHTIIPSLGDIIDNLSRFNTFNLQKFRVRDSNMEHILSRMPSMNNKTIKIFQIPSNADLKEGDEIPLFETIIFPRWSVCYAHPGTPILTRLEQPRSHVEIRCPTCEQNKLKSKVGLNHGSSVRFVKACLNGHMDDIDWIGEVHGNLKCPGTVFKWDESGNDINFKVSCYGHYDSYGKFCETKCGKSISYSTLRHNSDNDLMRCSGFFPESSKQESCSQNAKLMLKHSSNIRLVDFVTSVLIPPVPNKLAFLYKHREPLGMFFDSKPILEHSDLVKYCKNSNARYKSGYPMGIIENCTLQEIKSALDNISNRLRRTESFNPKSFSTEFYDECMIEDEYNSLLNAIEDGFPPIKEGEFTGLRIEPNDKVVFFNSDVGMKFKVSPIRELSLTRVQRGYSREVHVPALDEADEDEPPIRLRNGKLILCHFDEPKTDTRWFVGHQLRGEGLFIQLCDPDDDDLQYDPFTNISTSNVNSFTAWNKTYCKCAEKNSIARNRTNPRFVWWHTLAHKIINNLAIQSGFSAASIAERVYCYENHNKHTSGILLYTAQPGGDGTMGGLVSMAPHFNNLITNAISDLRTCSNDPICKGRTKSAGRFNGSACHACLFVSETSCESQNKFLDRNIVLETTKQ